MLALRTIPGTEIRISPIGLGCWQFSGGKGVVGGFWPALPQATARDVVKASLEDGVTFFDTAEVYGGGASELSLADALRSAGAKPADVVVATKWVPLPTRTARSIVDTIDDRIENLGEYPVALHQIHRPSGSLSTHAQQMRALATLVKSGKVKAVGVSNFGARAMRECHAMLANEGVKLASNQVRFGLLDRSIERDGVLDAARELGVMIIAYSPLAQGVLSGRFHDGARPAGMRRFLPAFSSSSLAKSRPLIDVLRAIAAKHGATASQIALHWTVTAHGDVVVAIPGASSVKQARENAAAMKLSLSDDERAQIAHVASR